MHGLDNTTTRGVNIMESLQTVVTRLGKYRLDIEKNSLIDIISFCNQHLEFDVKSHFSRTFSCNVYCTIFAFSFK